MSRPRLLDLSCCAGGASMDWTSSKPRRAEAIPPAYTQWIGERLALEVAESGERAA